MYELFDEADNTGRAFLIRIAQNANKTKKPPEKPYTIAGAVTYLSWPGGPKRAPGGGPPGVKTIWVGLDKLNTLLAYKEWIV